MKDTRRQESFLKCPTTVVNRLIFKRIDIGTETSNLIMRWRFLKGRGHPLHAGEKFGCGAWQFDHYIWPARLVPSCRSTIVRNVIKGRLLWGIVTRIRGHLKKWMSQEVCLHAGLRYLSSDISVLPSLCTNRAWRHYEVWLGQNAFYDRKVTYLCTLLVSVVTYAKVFRASYLLTNVS